MDVETDFIKPWQVFVDVNVSTKHDALIFLAQKGAELGIGTSEAAILSAFLDREALGPTGMEDGLAIPHAKSSEIKRPAVCLAKFAHPLEWESISGGPSSVSVAVTLYVPAAEAGTTHVKYLSKVAVIASRPGFSSFISGCNDPVEIASYLNRSVRQ